LPASEVYANSINLLADKEILKDTSVMKTSLFTLVVIFAAIVLCSSSCGRHAAAAGSAKDTIYVPFTKALKQRIENNHLDIKKIQFFVDQRLVLRRSMGTQKNDIKSGVILFENGQYINEVIIPKNTPGVCMGVNGDRLLVSFEIQNNNVEFGPGGMNEAYFTLYARNWSGGTADITYDNKTYKVQCASCFNAGDVKLGVRKSEADKLQKTQRVVEGRKVDN
jgi:hypothetical protein